MYAASSDGLLVSLSHGLVGYIACLKQEVIPLGPALNPVQQIRRWSHGELNTEPTHRFIQDTLQVAMVFAWEVRAVPGAGPESRTLTQVYQQASRPQDSP